MSEIAIETAPVGVESNNGRPVSDGRDGTTDELTMGLQATGLVGGAVAGFGVLRLVKGSEADQAPIHQNTLDNTRASDTKAHIGVPPKNKFHHESGTEHLADVGIVGGPMLVGFAAGTLLARLIRATQRA